MIFLTIAGDQISTRMKIRDKRAAGVLQEFRDRGCTRFIKTNETAWVQGREEKREVKIRRTDPKRIDGARTWIVGEGISIIQAEAAIAERTARWTSDGPMKKPVGEFLASRLASAVVDGKRQKISQGPSLRFVVDRPKFIPILCSRAPVSYH